MLQVSYNGEFSIRGPYQEATDASFPPIRGVVIGGIREGKYTDFLVWIALDRQSIGFHAFDGRVNPEPFPIADTSCDVFEALHPMDPTSGEGHPRFLLHCSQNNAAKLYEVIFNFTSGDLRSNGEVPGFMGSLVLSPNSTYLCLWTESSITVFQTADYSKQQFLPFDSPIVAAYFVPSDSPSPRLYVSTGPAGTIVDVAEFFSDTNTGVFTVPALAANCASDGRCLPQQLSSDCYLVIVQSGSAWQALVYHADELTEPFAVVDLSDPPASAFLQLTPKSEEDVGMIVGISVGVQLTSSPSPTPNPEEDEDVRKIVGISVGLGTCILVAIAFLVALLLCTYRRRKKMRVKSRKRCSEHPDTGLTVDEQEESEFGDDFKPNEASADANVNADPAPLRLKTDPAPPSLMIDPAPPSLTANPDKSIPDKAMFKGSLHSSQMNIEENNRTCTSGAHTHHTQGPVQESTPLSTERNEIALLKRERQSTPTHHLTPRSDRQDSGVDTPLSTISSASLASLPSRSSSAMGRISPRSHSPGDGRSSSEEDLPTQICSSSSSRSTMQLVAPSFSHPTSP